MPFTQGFESLAESLSPYLTGGILNYVFEPINSSEMGQKMLTTREITKDNVIQFLKDIIIHSVQSTEVLDVLPLSAEQKEHGQNRYLVGLVVAVVFTVIPLCIWLSLMIIPFYLKKKSRRHYGVTCYYVFAAICLIFLVTALVMVTCAFIATSSLAVSVNPELKGKPNPNQRINDAIAALTEGIQLFTKESFEGGTVHMQTFLKRVEQTLDTTFYQTVHGIISDLLSAYKLVQLIDTGKQLSTNLTLMTRKTAIVNGMQVKTLKEINEFLGKIKALHKNFATTLTKTCQTLKGSQRGECDTYKANLNSIDLSFDSSKIDTQTSIALNAIGDIVGPRVADLSKKGSSKEDDLANKSRDITKQIRDSINLNGVFKAAVDVLKSLNDSVGSQLNNNLGKMQLHVKEFSQLAYIFIKVANICITLLSLLILICGATYVIWKIFRSIQAPSSKCTPPLCILPIIFVILGFPLFAMTIFGVVAIVPMWARNEVCRYFVHPRGLEITETSLNLFLEHYWPILLKDTIGVQAKLLQQTSPRNILKAITSSCGAVRSNTQSQGLLTLVGLTELLNISEVFHSPTVTKIIIDNEQTVIQFVSNANIPSLIPTDVYDLTVHLEKLANIFDKVDYKDSIDLLKNIININESERILRALQLYADTMSNNTDKTMIDISIKDNVKLLKNKCTLLDVDIRILIKEYESLTSVAQTLFRGLRFFSHVDGRKNDGP